MDYRRAQGTRSTRRPRGPAAEERRADHPALLAALGAVAALRAGDTVNEALVLKTEAGRDSRPSVGPVGLLPGEGHQGQRAGEIARNAWAHRSAGRRPPSMDQAIQKYAADQRAIETAARDKERERDDESQQRRRLLERHHRFRQQRRVHPGRDCPRRGRGAGPPEAGRLARIAVAGRPGRRAVRPDVPPVTRHVAPRRLPGKLEAGPGCSLTLR